MTSGQGSVEPTTGSVTLTGSIVLPATLVVGEALMDVVHPHGGGEPVEHVGGSPANVAVGLATLGHRTRLSTLIGTDRRGMRIAGHLSSAWVQLVPGSVGEHETSVAQATLDASGAATYDFTLRWDAPPLPEHRGHVHTGSIAATLEPGGTAIETWLVGQRSRGTISYDPNARPAIMGEPHEVRARVEQIVGLSDVVKASDEDIAWLYDGATPEQVLPLWGRLGPSLVVATSRDGALVHLPLHGRTTTVEASPVEVVDTVGAGDSFMAGLLSGLLDAGLLGAREARDRWADTSADDILTAVRRGLATAAWTVQRAGAQSPRREDLPTI